MGQTVSCNAARTELYASNTLSTTDMLWQLLLRNSGLTLASITPGPGWFVYKTAHGFVFRFRPLSSDVTANGFQDVHVATFSTPLSASVTVTLHPSEVVWNGNRSAGTDWITAQVEVMDQSMLLSTTPRVTVAQSTKRLCRVEVTHNSDPTVTYLLSNNKLEALEDGTIMVKDGRQLPLGETEFTIIASSGGVSRSATVTVDVLEGDTVVTNDVVSLNPYDDVTLQREMFEFPDEANEAGNDVTHVLFSIPSTLVIEQNGVEYLDVVVFAMADLDSALISRRTSTRRGASRGGANTRTLARGGGGGGMSLEFWLSFDGGLEFSTYGCLEVAPFPCFDTKARVCVGFQKGRMVWKAIPKLKRGDAVMCRGSKMARVRSVVITRRILAQLMLIPVGSLGANVPNRSLAITTNHRVWCPGMREPIPAGKMIRMLGKKHGIKRIQRREKLCHVELDRYDYMLVDNLPAESCARSRAALNLRLGKATAPRRVQRRRGIVNVRTVSQRPRAVVPTVRAPIHKVRRVMHIRGRRVR